MAAVDHKARRTRSKLPDGSHIPGVQTGCSMDANGGAWSLGVEVVPRLGIEITAIRVAEMKVQPVIGCLFQSLPASRCFLAEWPGGTPRKRNFDHPILEAVRIIAGSLCQPRECVVVG